MATKIKGLKKLLKKLEKLENIEKDVDRVFEGIAFEIQGNAVLNAPINNGDLRQSIKQEKIRLLRYDVIVNADYGAYIEFGTGAKVKVPVEFQEMALTFKNNDGSFEDGLQSIKDWCKSKGIPIEAAYPIFISILNNGINPQPFLYPAFKKGRIQLKKDLKELLKQKTK